LTLISYPDPVSRLSEHLSCPRLPLLVYLSWKNLRTHSRELKTQFFLSLTATVSSFQLEKILASFQIASQIRIRIGIQSLFSDPDTEPDLQIISDPDPHHCLGRLDYLSVLLMRIRSAPDLFFWIQIRIRNFHPGSCNSELGTCI
jgi:hypothetical protein